MSTSSSTPEIRTISLKSVLVAGAVIFTIGYLLNMYLRTKEHAVSGVWQPRIIEDTVSSDEPTDPLPDQGGLSASGPPLTQNDIMVGESESETETAENAEATPPKTIQTTVVVEAPMNPGSPPLAVQPADPEIEFVSFLDDVRRRAEDLDPPPIFLVFSGAMEKEFKLPLFVPRHVRGLTGKLGHQSDDVVRDKDGYVIRHNFEIEWLRSDGTKYVQRGYRTFDYRGRTVAIRLDNWVREESVDTVREGYRIAKDIKLPSTPETLNQSK